MKKVFSQVALAALVTIISAGAQAATINASGCSQVAVQAAVNLAADGDTVLIPNGSAAWTGGISTTKQLRIAAQNYTPTDGGTMTRSVVITNHSTTVPLFEFTSGNSYHVGIAGIRFNEGTGDQNHIRVQGTGSKVPLVNDCAFEVKNRFGNNPDISPIAWLAQGGVIWNSYVLGVGGGLGGQCCPEGAGILVNSPRGWYTPSTMGALDVNGTVNVYFENCTFMNSGACPDTDDNGRTVFRHCLFDGSSGITHGFTSMWGGRHFEYYNNTFRVTTENRNIAGRYFWIRAGTGLFTENAVSSEYNGYGAPVQVDIGDNTDPQPYPQPRQPGWGHNGTIHVIDPIYIWNQTGNGAYKWEVGHGWENNVQLNRDIFVNSGPKPGYSKFTYPHPLRGVTANPSTFTAVFAAAKSGDVIYLESGAYGEFTGGAKAGIVTLKGKPGAAANMDINFNPASNLAIEDITVTSAHIHGNSRNINFRNVYFFPGQVTVRDGTGPLNLLFDRCHWGAINDTGCYEGRLSVPGSVEGPCGITVQNSKFGPGGNLDGIQTGGNGMRILNNEFVGIRAGNSGIHCDAIQLYGSRNTVIRGNYIHDCDSGIMAPDGTDHETIEHNVIDIDYWYPILIGSDNGSVIRHNTLRPHLFDSNENAGFLLLGQKSGNPAGKGTVVTDNIVQGVGIQEPATTAANEYNLCKEYTAGPHDIKGVPVFTGGVAPSTWGGYRLAAGSPGKNAASDGQDMGSNLFGEGSLLPAPAAPKNLRVVP